MNLTPQIASEFELNNNTLSKTASDELNLPIALEVGDSKQANFIPQVKFMKWDNEVNFSVRLSDPDFTAGTPSTNADQIQWQKGGKTASFYTEPKLVRPASPAAVSVRYQYNPSANYNEANIFADISDARPPSGLRLLAVSAAQPTICLNGFYTKEKYIDTSKVPSTMVWARKLTTSPAGAIVYDQGNIDFNFIGAKGIPDDVFITGIIAAMKSLGITAQHSGNDLTFTHNGVTKKFCGVMRETDDVFDFVINVSTDFSLYDFYKAPRLIPAGSLNELKPTLTRQQVVDAIVSTIAKATKLPVVADTYSSQEQAFVNRYTQLYADSSWVVDANADAFDVPRMYAQHNHDNFEFDLTVSQPLASNTVPFTVNSKAVTLHYQPRLTAEERDAGLLRLVDVIGSYAVYHSTQRDDTSAVGGKNYACGKVAHIYRPKITDANGVSVWGDLSFDEQASVLSVIIPQPFLDTAVYPLLIDPTFGYTTAGASFGGVANFIFGTATTGAAGTGTSMSWYGQQTNAGHKSQLAIYASGSLLTNGTTVTASGIQNGGAAGWTTNSFNSSPTLTATSYNICVWGNSVAKSTFNVNNDTLTSGGTSNATTYVDQSWPGTISFTTTNVVYSIYVTYTASGGAVTNAEFLRNFM